MFRFRFSVFGLLGMVLLFGANLLATPTPNSNLIAAGVTIHIKDLPEGQTWEGYWRETAKRQKVDPDKTPFLVVSDEDTKQWLQEKVGVWDEAYSLPETVVSANTPKTTNIFKKGGEQLPPALKDAGVSATFTMQGSNFSLRTPSLAIAGTVTIPQGPHGPGGTFKVALPKTRVKSTDFILVPLADPADGKVHYLLSFQIRVSDDRP